jgi:16S rRNA (uracil1498-N3)-methyltransferase
MNLFFIPELEGSQTSVCLGSEESRHCISSLRMIAGDLILLTNGRGLKATGRITGPDKKQCMVEVVETCHIPERNCRLHLAVAPTKNHDRFEWFAEKATELGVEEITPLICSRSERKKIQKDRLSRVITAALKQSGGYWLPGVNGETAFNELVRQSFAGTKYIAYCSEVPAVLLFKALERSANCTILIGPEGDFSQDEVKLAMQHGFQTVSLGRNRLRTETAAVTACSVFNLKNE